MQSIGCDWVKVLHILELTSNSIGETVADKLAVTLTSCTSFRELYLGNNELGTNGVFKVCQTIKDLLILQILSLS